MSAALAEQHRRAQLAIRAQALRDYTRLWQIWNPANPVTFGLLVAATLPLVRAYRNASAAVAASYYSDARKAEQIAGDATPRLAAAVVPEQIAASLYVTGKVMTEKAEQAGQSPETARETALVRTSGTVTRHVLQGGRDTIIQSVAADKHAVGWARVTDGAPCAFCLTLASRGAVYKTEQSASFEAHDHCGCSAMAVFDGSVIPNLDKWRNIYNAAQNQGEASGLLQPGENPPKARINAVRQHLAANPI